jgi:hypothetical protein
MTIGGDTRGADTAALSWRIREHPGLMTVEFAGEIDENADFSELRNRLRDSVAFQLADVRRINSCGVREWVNFVRDLPHVTELRFSHCSSAIVTQLNMIHNFRGVATIRSFYAPYFCAACGLEEDKLIEVATWSAANVLPDFACAQCGAAMEFDDLPDRYLSFLTE